MHEVGAYENPLLSEENMECFVTGLNDRLHILILAGFKPVPIFDGEQNPVKKAEECKRRKNKNHLDVHGTLKEAWIASLLFRDLLSFQAPYEADSQIAEEYFRLISLGEKCYVYGNDSDFMLYGVKHMIKTIDWSSYEIGLRADIICMTSELDDLRIGGAANAPSGKDYVIDEHTLSEKSVIWNTLMQQNLPFMPGIIASSLGGDYGKIPQAGGNVLKYLAKHINSATSLESTIGLIVQQVHDARIEKMKGNSKNSAAVAKKAAAQERARKVDEYSALACQYNSVFRHSVVFKTGSNTNEPLFPIPSENPESLFIVGRTDLHFERCLESAVGLINRRTGSRLLEPTRSDIIWSRYKSIVPMIDSNAALPEDDPNTPTMVLFLKSRGIEYSKMNVAELKDCIASIMQYEALTNKKVTPLSNSSVNHSSLYKGIREFDRQRPSRPIPPAGDSAWRSTAPKICEKFPLMEDSVIASHFLGKMGVIEESSRLAKKIHSRALSVNNPEQFRVQFHPGGTGICYAKGEVSATYRNLKYDISIELNFYRRSVDESNMSHAADSECEISAVRYADCTCFGGEGGQCHHVGVILATLALCRSTGSTGYDCKWSKRAPPRSSTKFQPVEEIEVMASSSHTKASLKRAEDMKEVLQSEDLRNRIREGARKFTILQNKRTSMAVILNVPITTPPQTNNPL
jgi:hypothetical protein